VKETEILEITKRIVERLAYDCYIDMPSEDIDSEDDLDEDCSHNEIEQIIFEILSDSLT